MADKDNFLKVQSDTGSEGESDENDLQNLVNDGKRLTVSQIMKNVDDKKKRASIKKDRSELEDVY